MDSEALAFEQRKQQKLLAQAQIHNNLVDLCADDREAEFEAELAKLYARQANLYSGPRR